MKILNHYEALLDARSGTITKNIAVPYGAKSVDFSVFYFAGDTAIVKCAQILRHRSTQLGDITYTIPWHVFYHEFQLDQINSRHGDCILWPGTNYLALTAEADAICWVSIRFWDNYVGTFLGEFVERVTMNAGAAAVAQVLPLIPDAGRIRYNGHLGGTASALAFRLEAQDTNSTGTTAVYQTYFTSTALGNVNLAASTFVGAGWFVYTRQPNATSSNTFYVRFQLVTF